MNKVIGFFILSICSITNSFAQEFVDLGLGDGTLWATCNIGANSPEDKGDYFAWGETVPKKSFTWSNLKYCEGGDGEFFTKYVNLRNFGTIDNRSVLSPEDDAATVLWGADWKIPTKEQFYLLYDKCELKETTVNGKQCIQIIGPNGNSIYLPTSGYYDNQKYVTNRSCYWTANLSRVTTPNAVLAYTYHGTYGDLHYDYDAGARYLGAAIRPVRKKTLIEEISVKLVGIAPTAQVYVDGKNVGKASNVKSLSVGTHIIRTVAGKIVTEKAICVESAKDNQVFDLKNNDLGVGKIDGHYYVDLGLPSGTLWATCNIGCKYQEDLGGYYAVAETVQKEKCTWDNLKYCTHPSEGLLSKYVNNAKFGTVDNKKTIEAQDDAAYVNWGSNWRIPTYEQFKELVDNCRKIWIIPERGNINGIHGCYFIGKNGKSIFLPAAGMVRDYGKSKQDVYGFYSTSSINNGADAWYYFFSEHSRDCKFSTGRCYGRSIRPVVAQ